MARQDDIEGLLRQIAPLFIDIAQRAQVAAADFADTDWARKHLARTASVNQMAGTGRWRIVGDSIVDRQAELPSELVLTTDDGEQNQGRYYLAAPELAIVLTVRRKPHPEDEQPAALQLQIEGVLENAPVDFGDQIVVYFAVPPIGQEPNFAVATRGKQTVLYRLIDLVEDRVASSETGTTTDLPAAPPPGTIVRSSLDAGEGQDQEGTDDERG
jgi:hypothetical protein